MSSLYLLQSKEIAARMLGDEMMIMSPRDSIVFSLNKVGTVIWEAADGKTPLEEIVRKICARFEVDPAEAFKDAESFVRELVQHELLVVSDQPIESDRPSRRPSAGHQEAP
jgi:GGDEF domain-containing protein